MVRYLNYYREGAQRMHGYTASSDQIGWAAPVYVADTDEQGARGGEAATSRRCSTSYLRLPFEMLFPPGYLSTKSLKNMRSHKRLGGGQEHTVDTLIEQGIILCGSPDTVRRRSDGQRIACSASRISSRCCNSRTLPRDLTEKNIRLFAREVLPALQALTDKEYAGMETRRPSSDSRRSCVQ